MTEEQFVELSATIAGAWLEDAYLDNAWTEDENGDEVYTEDAQDRFNDIYDTVQNIMHRIVEIERKDR
jgi:glutathionylspermidine synthase